ncbi:hypothetical protein [uncultured Methylobacterium sp.]|uniref:hypothetical protein n=1 Tax=uncultured Methylobacterium sp. TaxID=157278 RepID=UPI00261C7843|nr:hypothetical protein [uncultured Methylobacterium sp.]
MFTRILNSLCLRVLGSSTIGRMVRAGIVLASRDAMPRVETAIGGAGALVELGNQNRSREAV